MVNGFYEWKWLDQKGKEKQRHYIQLDSEDDAFALGGIYNHWVDRTTGEEIISFSIVTTDANELMVEIHNTKQRMPLVLSKQAREAWLSEVNYKVFTTLRLTQNLCKWFVVFFSTYSRFFLHKCLNNFFQDFFHIYSL